MRMGIWSGVLVLLGASAAGQEPVRVSGGVMDSQAVEKVAPVYPPIAKAAHVQGAVVLHAVIGEDGIVKNLEVVSGPEMLRESAVEAVRHWVYQPYLLHGRATAVDTTVTVRYAMADGDHANATRANAGPVRVAGGVMQGMLLTQVQPVYPAEAKVKGVSGTVVLRAVVGRDGTVENLSVITGPEELRGAAVDAVSQWMYKPFRLNGEPVEVETTVVVNFGLGG